VLGIIALVRINKSNGQLGGLGMALAGIFGAAVKIVWNFLMPGLFHLPAITWLQAVALLWIGRRLDSRMFATGALCCYAVVLLRLAGNLLDGSAFAHGGAEVYWAGLKDRLAEFVAPILSLFGGWRLFRAAAAGPRTGSRQVERFPGLRPARLATPGNAFEMRQENEN